MKNKKLINVVRAALVGNYSEAEEARVFLEEEYGITFAVEKKETVAEASQVFSDRARNVPLVELLPVEKPKKVKHFVPQNVGKSVKRSQKPLYRYRRR